MPKETIMSRISDEEFEKKVKSSSSLKEIAYRCGYSDVGYFRTVFKRKIGKSIKAYLSDATRYEY